MRRFLRQQKWPLREVYLGTFTGSQLCTYSHSLPRVALYRDWHVRSITRVGRSLLTLCSCPCEVTWVEYPSRRVSLWFVKSLRRIRVFGALRNLGICSRHPGCDFKKVYDKKEKGGVMGRRVWEKEWEVQRGKVRDKEMIARGSLECDNTASKYTSCSVIATNIIAAIWWTYREIMLVWTHLTRTGVHLTWLVYLHVS